LTLIGRARRSIGHIGRAGGRPAAQTTLPRTIEERMMQMTKKKMVLEHLVVGRMKKEYLNQVLIFYKFIGH
jgi:hypothetical protein